MHFLFLFMDGVGFGADNPETNPFAAAKMPNLTALLGGQRMVKGVAPLHTERATLLELDARLGVEGLPQSATGQVRRGKHPSRWSSYSVSPSTERPMDI